jgi:hypothetical protein
MRLLCGGTEGAAAVGDGVYVRVESEPTAQICKRLMGKFLKAGASRVGNGFNRLPHLIIELHTFSRHGRKVSPVFWRRDLAPEILTNLKRIRREFELA